MKAVDYTVNSPHLALGSELVADFRGENKSRHTPRLSGAGVEDRSPNW